MPNGLAHFAINAKDPERAVAFYQAVFGWKTEPWGPPGFYLVDTGEPVRGAIQAVQEQPIPTVIGNWECSLAVEDVDATCAAITEHGGTVTFAKVTIPGVGDIARVTDCEGNTFSVVRYLR